MSKIVFIEMPASGHVNPTLPVVQELVRRGEHVTYYATEEFRSQIEQTGATFQPYPVRVLTSTDILGSTDFFRQCFEAFADMPAQFILSVGKQTDIQALGKIPANFI